MPTRKKNKYFRDDTFLKKVGENVRKFRKIKGLTQMDLAFACNEMDYSQINRIELGKINFSISFLVLIAEKLDVSPADLIPAAADL
ncbi:MAG: hypothetical protein RIQ33_499 [Bacteroidota bacterium]